MKGIGRAGYKCPECGHTFCIGFFAQDKDSVRTQAMSKLALSNLRCPACKAPLIKDYGKGEVMDSIGRGQVGGN